MDCRSSLLAEISAIVGPQRPSITRQLWTCLGRYQISDTAAASSFPESQQAFLSAKRVDGLSSKTIKEYRRILTTVGSTMCKPPASITTDDIRGYLAEISTRLRPNSVQTYSNVLRSFFSWLQTEGQLEKNPMLKIKSHRVDRKSTRKPLTSRELERVRRACRVPRERALLELMVSTGCRVSEISALRRDSVNCQTHSLTVTGKGSKTRMVLFSARAELALEEYLSDAPDSEYVFSGKDGRALCIAVIQKAMHTLGVCAGISGKLHPHRLRHTFASMALNRGMDLAVLQLLLGHESADTTEIYAKLSPATVARAYARAVA